jgi:hypothetical protein
MAGSILGLDFLGAKGNKESTSGKELALELGSK